MGRGRLALLAAAALGLALLAYGLGRDRWRKPLLPDIMATAGEIELSRGRERLLLVRRPDGRWLLRSAADLPARQAKVAALLSGVAALRGAGEAGAADPSREGTALTVRASSGRLLARMSVRPSVEAGSGGAPDAERGEAVVVELYSPRRASAVGELPVGGLAPADWADLPPPEIRPARVTSIAFVQPGRVVRFERGPDGRFLRSPPPGGPAGGSAPRGGPVDHAGLERLLTALAALGPRGFRMGDAINWAGGRYLQLVEADGLTLEAQAVPRDGGAWLRLNAQASSEAAGPVRDRAERLRLYRKLALPMNAEGAATLLRPPEAFAPEALAPEALAP